MVYLQLGWSCSQRYPKPYFLIVIKNPLLVKTKTKTKMNTNRCLSLMIVPVGTWRCYSSSRLTHRRSSSTRCICGSGGCIGPRSRRNCLQGIHRNAAWLPLTIQADPGGGLGAPLCKPLCCVTFFDGFLKQKLLKLLFVSNVVVLLCCGVFCWRFF